MYDINTIFYFTTKAEYESNLDKISPKTIVFVSDERAIYKNGVRYSGSDSQEIENIINEYYSQNPSELPKATTSSYGVVKIDPQGGLLVNNGILSVDKLLFKGDKGDKGDTGDTGATGPQGPTGPLGPQGEVDPEIIQQIEDAVDHITDLYDNIENEVTGVVEDLFEDSTWMNQNLKDTVQSWSNFGEDDVEAYLQRIGIITLKEGNNLTFAWSSIAQNWDSITSTVNRLEGKESGWDAYQSAISQKVDATGAVTAITNTYADVVDLGDIKKVLRWMYSGLTSSATSDAAWNDLVSAAGDSTHGAIADVYTLITRVKENEFVSKTGLISEITQKSGDIWTALNSAGFLAQTDLDSAVATIFAEGTGTGSYSNQKYYYCDAVGTTEASPTYDLKGGETITEGSYYSSSELASKCVLLGTNTAITSSDIDANTPPIIVADGSDRYTLIAAKATEAALSTTKLRAAIEVGVKNDTSFINAIAQQVNVSTDELSIVNSTDNTKKVVVNGTGIKTLTKSGVTWNDINAIKYDGSGFLGNIGGNGISWDTNGIVTINSHRDNSGGNQLYDYSDVFIGFKSIPLASHNPYEIEVVESDNSTDVNTVNINPIDGLTVDKKYLSGNANSRYNVIYGADSISVSQEGAASNFSIKVPNGVGALDSIISFGTGSSSLRETDITSKLNVTGTIHTDGDISANGAISASNFSGKDDFLITNGADPSITGGAGDSSTILKADTNPIVVHGKNKPVKIVGTTGTSTVLAKSVVSTDGGTVSLDASTKVSVSTPTIEFNGLIKIYYNGSFYNLNLSALESAGYLTAA